MKYILFEAGPVTVYSYGLMIALGVILTFVVAQKRAKNYGLDPDAIFYMGAWGLLAGILGAKLLFYLTEIKEIIKDPSLLLNVSEGFVVYGGIIGGILGAYIYAKIKKIDILAYFDLAVPSIAFAQGFGRIGCFLAGCCYGRETNAWYGITFHNSPFAPNEVALIPTQLISSVADFAHFFILIFLAKRVKHKGVVTAMYLIFYSVGRFLIEMLRNDPRGTISAMSTSQFISIFTLAAGIFMFVFCRRKRQGEEKQEA